MLDPSRPARSVDVELLIILGGVIAAAVLVAIVIEPGRG
jgi:hypothetical protein